MVDTSVIDDTENNLTKIGASEDSSDGAAEISLWVDIEEEVESFDKVMGDAKKM